MTDLLASRCALDATCRFRRRCYDLQTCSLVHCRQFAWKMGGCPHLAVQSWPHIQRATRRCRVGAPSRPSRAGHNIIHNQPLLPSASTPPPSASSSTAPPPEAPFYCHASTTTDTHELASLVASADAFALAPQVAPSATSLALCDSELGSLAPYGFLDSLHLGVRKAETVDPASSSFPSRRCTWPRRT
jgi:hypothetical protein